MKGTYKPKEHTETELIILTLSEVFLFWLRKISLRVKMYQLSFCVFFWFIWASSFLFTFLCYPYFGNFTFLFI
jgi:hypothetical protein